MDQVEESILTTTDVDDDSIHYAVAFDQMNELMGHFHKNLTTDAVAAMLSLLADYSIPPGDNKGCDVFLELAKRAAESARDGST